ncbi:putative chaperone protein HSP31 [Tetrabaena socialis]|uniref:Putative chaperone protein HSP31 n=1 Tax=Tetrabaena socialis TaxID=47790 RepID=A0A2J8AJJ5_9CHLO|nr:putative chaperone protein HSP31 [Tetrabaena socialis]|eukprot:PNH12695.1 putative chaperone protein HSP31 [Tetrabaena socialis]
MMAGYNAATLQLRGSVPLSSVTEPTAYACIYLAGGQGCMADFAESKEVARVVGEAVKHGHLVAAVCHGPAGLLSVTGEDGRPLVAGKTVACFTQEEEDKTGAAGERAGRGVG